MQNFFSIGGFTIPDPLSPGSSGGAGEAENTDRDPIEDGSVTVRRQGKLIHCLTVIGQIEGHTALPESVKTTRYEHMIPRIVAVEQSEEIDALLLILNTVGGDVEAGLAIAELLAGMNKPVVSLVLGGGHSIGVPIAVAAKESFIARSATMTIHPVRISGLMLGVPQAFDYFQRMQQRITDFVTAHSHISAERYHALAMNTDELVMDVGTILDGEDAVKEGLIDHIGTLNDAISALYHRIAQDHPETVKTAVRRSGSHSAIRNQHLSDIPPKTLSLNKKRTGNRKQKTILNRSYQTGLPSEQ